MSATRRCVVALLLLATSCAQKSAPESAGIPLERVTRDPYVISRDELQDPAVAARDANYVIQQLRPAFFRTRGPQTLRKDVDPAAAPGTVHISQDFGPLQPITGLAAIDVRSLIEIRYFNAVEAQARFGINANGGPVIVLLSTKQ